MCSSACGKRRQAMHPASYSKGNEPLLRGLKPKLCICQAACSQMSSKVRGDSFTSSQARHIAGQGQEANKHRGSLPSLARLGDCNACLTALTVSKLHLLESPLLFLISKVQ